MSCGTARSGDPFEILDGAYVLGALDPAERAEFETHLSECAACRTRVQELRPLPDHLAAVDDANLAPPAASDRAEPVPDTLLPGLLRRAARERRRRRIVVSALGAAVAACVLSLVVVLWPSSGTPTPTPRAQALTAVVASPVHATAQLVAKAWGTQIDLRCTYDYGVPSGVPYDLRVYDKSGAPHDAGSWQLVPGHVTKWSGGTSVPRDQISKIQVLGPRGRPILQLNV